MLSRRGRTRFDIAVIGDLDGLPTSACANLYRVAQEAITNAAKHARAGTFELRLEANEADIVLTVEDDGEATGTELAPKAGMGLLGMQERVVSLGGTLHVRAATCGRRPACRAAFPTGGQNHEHGRGHEPHARDRWQMTMPSCARAIARCCRNRIALQVVAEADNGADAYRIYKASQARPRHHGPVDAGHRRGRGHPADPAMGQVRAHPRLHDAPERRLCGPGDQGGRPRLCHQEQPARGAAARDRRGDGRTHRAQPRYRPRARHQIASPTNPRRSTR